MPATLVEVAAGIERVLGSGEALTVEQLILALETDGLDLGADPADTLDAALDEDSLPLVLPLGDGRHASLPALLDGRTFTHRVTAGEIEHGFLVLSPDLEPVSILTDDPTYIRLVDGSPVVQALPMLDGEAFIERGIPLEAAGDGVWLLEPDRLNRLGIGPGDVVGVTVRSAGFELSAASAASAAPDLAAGLTAALQQLADGEPEQTDSVAWLACAEDPTLFATPGPPLVEVFADAGLAWEGEQVAPAGFDFGGWRLRKRVEYVADIHELDEDEAMAVLALVRIYEQVSGILDRANETVEAGQPLSELLAGPEDPSPSPADTDRETTVGRLVRAMLPYLAEPAVAAAVLVETIGAGRDGAAALGLFADTLEAQAPRSARPACRWLQGKSLERLGKVADAERAFEAALTLDATWRPALYDVARCASDRGDAERGLSLLRRAGAPADDDLMVLLTRFRPTERKDIGRNDPCWCGSGRKSKQCHRGLQQPPIEERAAWLYQKAGAYLSDGPWRTDVLATAGIRSAHWDRPLASYEATQDPLVCDAVLFEGGAFEEFLGERGGLLPDDERLLGEQWLLAERSVYEVEKITPGSGFTARDLRTGDRVTVRERTASRSVKAGMLICARLVPAGETVQCFGGMEPVALHERDALLELLDSEPDPDELVEFLSRRFASPVLQNTEGEDLAFCEATLRSPDPSALAAALDDTYDRVDENGPPRWFENVTTYGTPRIRATLTLDENLLTVETNSVSRMDRVVKMVQNLQPDIELVARRTRDFQDVQEVKSRAPGGGAPVQALDPNTHPELAAALEQMIRQHETAWLDEQIPALAGATPREAAADPTRRPDLLRLLDSYGPARPGTMDPARLRAQLGL